MSSHARTLDIRRCSSWPNAIRQLIEQLCQPRLVRITCWAVAIGFDPLRMLCAEIVVNLLLQFGVSIDLVRHGSGCGNWFGHPCDGSLGEIIPIGSMDSALNRKNKRRSSRRASASTRFYNSRTDRRIGKRRSASILLCQNRTAGR